MSSDINVLHTSQRIIVEPFSSSVAVINAGPPGPAGALGAMGPAGPLGGEVGAQRISAQTGTAYTLALVDKESLITMNNAAASTVTVPPNSSVAFAVGTRIDVARLGTGSVTIVQGSGVTINKTSTLVLRLRYSVVSLIKLATDTWLLTGDVA